MPSIRKRKQFAATLLTPQGTRLSDCYVFLEIETTVRDAERSVSWAGRLTSFSEAQFAYAGLHGLRADGSDATARIDITRGAESRAGLTSDEYEFRGSGDPPELP
jgi:hypothetical protein